MNLTPLAPRRYENLLLNNLIRPHAQVAMSVLCARNGLSEPPSGRCLP
jgi:hypothetical protein